MNYAYTILYVKSVKDTLDFYEKAFGFIRKFVTPEQDYGELISGETTLAFANPDCSLGFQIQFKIPANTIA